MNDSNALLARTTTFELECLEQKIGATEETLKMRKYLVEIILQEDDRIVSDILSEIQTRIQELSEEFSKRDTLPPDTEPTAD